MKFIYDWIIGLFKRRQASVEKRLSADALAAVQKEAAFLRVAHGVEVAALAEGEIAGKPRAVDDKTESELSPQ